MVEKYLDPLRNSLLQVKVFTCGFKIHKTKSKSVVVDA